MRSYSSPELCSWKVPLHSGLGCENAFHYYARTLIRANAEYYGDIPLSRFYASLL